MATHLITNMSNIVNPFTTKTFSIDPEIFTPLLKEDLTQSTPSFSVTNPLKNNNFAADFAADFDSDREVPFLVNLNKITHNLKGGFLNPKQEPSHQQWLCSFFQILSAIGYGLSKFKPGDNFPSTISNLNPNKEIMVKDLGKAFKALHQFII
jgi:hypothetical protein